MPKGRAVTLHRQMDHLCVTTFSPRDGIVLWELQEQKCPQHVCQHTDVVQTGQVGWMVLILQWKMVKLTGTSALLIVVMIAEPRRLLLWKTVDPTLSTNFHRYFFVTHAIVVQTECESNSTSRCKRTHKSLRSYMCIRFLTCDVVNLSSLS